MSDATDSKPIHLAIAGAAGRMGARLIALTADDGRWKLVAALERRDSAALGRDAGEVAGGGQRGILISSETSCAFDVLLDFSSPEGTQHWLDVCAEMRRPIVIGTTGHTPAQRAEIDSATKRIAVLRAANMSVGITALLELVGQLTQRLGAEYDIEIVETHHRRKVDAPSGTALMIKDAIVAARGNVSPVIGGRSGAVGARPHGEIAIHAVRGGGVVGEHEIRFLSEGEQITVRHVAESRDIFAHGALAAARWIVGRPAGSYSMRDVIAAR